MTEPVWLTVEDIQLLHDYVLVRTGGASGIRDMGLLESALERPRNRFHYEAVEDLSVLAATYAVGVANNHPFVDGNKRAGFLALGLFLEMNGRRLVASDDDATITMLGVAAGEVEIEALAVWIAANSAGD